MANNLLLANPQMAGSRRPPMSCGFQPSGVPQELRVGRPPRRTLAARREQPAAAPCLHAGRVDQLLHLGGIASVGEFAKQAFPYSAPRPAHEAIVDSRVWSIV